MKKKLFLKKEPEYLTMLTNEMKEDVSHIRGILDSHGYEAAEATIVKAWEKVSDDRLCMSWLPTDHMKDDLIFTAIMCYLTE
jgi:hypothetical protein